jgi:hypothetical protein
MKEESMVQGLDTSRPNIARVYDYWLGGKDSGAGDRRRAYTSRMTPGSVMVISRGHTDDATLSDKAQQRYTAAIRRNHSRAAALDPVGILNPGRSF